MSPCDLLADLSFDAAIHKVGSKSVDPLAEVLAKRGIPSIFASGYDNRGMTEAYAARRRIQKPYCPEGLLAALQNVVAEKPQSA